MTTNKTLSILLIVETGISEEDIKGNSVIKTEVV